MKKIVLTSCGIIDENFKKEFYKLFNKDVSDLKMLYITVAVDGEKDPDREWVEEEFQTILDLGIKKENIIEYKMDYDLDMTEYDFIYMMGGNTFYLIKKIREYNFSYKIKEAIEKGVVYVGSSAGSEVLGITIEVALPYDENNCGLEDFTGLNIIDAVIIPHVNRKRAFLNEQREKYGKYNKEIYELYDGRGIIINEDTIKRI